MKENKLIQKSHAFKVTLQDEVYHMLDALCVQHGGISKSAMTTILLLRARDLGSIKGFKPNQSTETTIFDNETK